MIQGGRKIRRPPSKKGVHVASISYVSVSERIHYLGARLPLNEIGGYEKEVGKRKAFRRERRGEVRAERKSSRKKRDKSY